MEIKKYLDPTYKSNIYDTCVKFYDRLKVHADGDYAGHLIEERRPSESETIKDYRKKIYVAITEGYFNKILTALMKIRKSPDWNISYKNQSPASINPEETLEKYCEVKYPIFGSITNWAFNIALKQYLIDSNGICVDKPNITSVAENEYLKPVAEIFNCDKVIEFVEGEYAIYKSYEESIYSINGSVRTDGCVIYAIDKDIIISYKTADDNKGFVLVSQYKHGLGYLPVRSLRGNYYKQVGNKIIYKPKVYSIVNRFDEAIREYSDLQAEVVQHIHSKYWSYATQQCNTCHGTGKVQSNGQLTNCTNHNCKDGYISASPYDNIVVKPEGFEKNTSPIPPAGYIQKQVEIVKIQEERINNHLYDGLASINMEFLAMTPMNQSGESKKVDKDELNTFVNSIAEDLVSLMDWVYKVTNDYRYTLSVPNVTKRNEMLPIISVPERFDLLNTDYLLAELSTARTSKMNPLVILELEIDYVSKKFTQDSEIYKKLRSSLELDPLVSLTEDEKVQRLQNDGIDNVTYITSCNIITFIEDAVIENKDFYKMPIQEQKAIIFKMAEQKELEISTEGSILTAVNSSQQQSTD